MFCIKKKHFLDELLGLFRYPPGSGRALHAGTLPLRYCAARFACKTPTWRLSVSGHVVDLVAAHVGAVWEAVADGALQAVHWVSGSGPGRKRIRQNRKTLAHLAGLMVQSRPRVWKRLHHAGPFVFLFLIVRGGGVIRIMLGSGLGLGNSMVSVQAHVSRFALFQLACSCMQA